MATKKRNTVQPMAENAPIKSASTGSNVINGVRLSSKLVLHSFCQPIARMLIANVPTGEPDSNKIITVPANDGKTGEPMDLQYTNYKVIGNGSFGVVFQAKLLPGGDLVAIKKVLQDKRFKV